jgi:hypothetical protein
MRDNPFCELRADAVEPDANVHCDECGELGPGDKLLRFVTVRGRLRARA